MIAVDVVLLPPESVMDEAIEMNKELLKKFENKIKRKIHLFIVRNIHSLNNKQLVNSIINGITIQGEIIWT